MNKIYKEYLQNGVIDEDNAVDIIEEQGKEIERLNAIIDKLNEKGKFLTDVANEKQNRIDRAMAYNNFILKEEWYGGNEKKYAQRNIDILLGKEIELREIPRMGVDKK